ncbi:MAG: hypothetical protein IKM85_06810 [Bacteroidales bacterium]|nr:hypothetical protein [Bacteroidales bacterium]
MTTRIITRILMVTILVATLMAACNSTVVELEDRPCRELEGIDSLMWKEPDSALKVMMEFAAKVEADSMDAFEGHYCQLLISELLYKNYYGQSNREELLKAVGYFDSIVAADEADTRKADARDASLRERNVFLDARAHYINGAGLYERNDVVNACAEYLKALEVMEEQYEEKELTGKKAVFMFYAYNRLLTLFSAQFMMGPAIECGEKALAYCQKESSLFKEIPTAYYHIGKQYDKMGEKDVARRYYGQAIEGLSDINNPVYRDVVSTKALCDYQVGLEADASITAIKKMLDYANSEKETLTRLLTIGGIFTVEQSFDSAIYYLEPVFENKDDVSLQIRAAEYLLVDYDHLGDKAKSDECMRFLANHKKTDGETKALVSELEAMFKNYQNQKQEKQIAIEREKAMRKALGIIIPIIVVVLVVYFVLILRNKKQLKKQQEEADRMLGETEQEHEKELRLWQTEAEKTLEETVKKHEEALKTKDSQHEQEMKAKQAEAMQQMEAAQRSHEEELKRQQAETERLLEEAERKHQQKMEEMMKRHEAELRLQKDQSDKEIEQTRQRHEAELEAERLAYQKEREELQLSLQLSKRNVNTLQEELGRKRTDAKGHYEAFVREPVCVKINDAVRDLQITTRKPYTSYRVNFDDETLTQFGQVVSAYYGEVKPALLCLYPSIAQEDLLLCYLYLLGMENKQIAVVRQREYSTVRKQAGELKRRLGIEESVRDYVLGVAGVEEFVEE